MVTFVGRKSDAISCTTTSNKAIFTLQTSDLISRINDAPA
jgi:hypothetical protein